MPRALSETEVKEKKKKKKKRSDGHSVVTQTGLDKKNSNINFIITVNRVYKQVKHWTSSKKRGLI